MQDQELTGWFELSDQKPWEPGVYEVRVDGKMTPSAEGSHSYWTGDFWGYLTNRGTEYAADWRSFGGVVYRTWTNVTHWRGLSSDPNAKPKPKRSGNPKVTRYVVIDVMKGEPVASFHTRDAAVDYAERMAWPRIKRVRHRSPE